MSENQRITLLVLSPGTGKGMIECNRSEFNLRQAPPYEALSYAPMTKGKNPVNIECDGKSLSIPAELSSIFERLRAAEKKRYLWDSTLCANKGQTTIKQQLRQKTEIYANATRELVWLGTNDPFDTFLTQEPLSALLNRFCAHVAYSHAEDDLEGQEEGDGETPEEVCGEEPAKDTDEASTQAITEVPDKDTENFFTCLGNLLAQPWFSSSEALHEVGAAKNALVIFGNHGEVDFDYLMRCVWHVHNDTSSPYSVDHSEIAYLFSIFPNRTSEFGPKAKAKHEKTENWNFLEAFRLACHLFPKGGMPKLHPLLELPYAQLDNKPLIDPDCGKPLADLRIQFAIDLIELTGNLQVVSVVHHANEDLLQKTEATWAPTWRGPIPEALGCYRPPLLIFNAAKGLRGKTKIDKTALELRTNGYVLGVVEECIQPNHLKESKGKVGIDAEQLRLAMKFKGMTYERLADLGHVIISGYYWYGPRRGANSDFLLKRDFAEFLERADIMPTEKMKLKNDVAAFVANAEVKSQEKEKLEKLKEQSKNPDFHGFYHLYPSAMEHRKLFLTNNSLLGHGPKLLREGDLCCILYGLPVPVILRRDEKEKRKEERYRVIGEGYVHKAMDGEKVNTAKSRVFCLI